MLRLGPGGVFLLFGTGKFQNDIWAQTIRNMAFFEAMPWTTDTSVVLAGILELVVAAGLILGIWLRRRKGNEPPPR